MHTFYDGKPCWIDIYGSDHDAVDSAFKEIRQYLVYCQSKELPDFNKDVDLQDLISMSNSDSFLEQSEQANLSPFIKVRDILESKDVEGCDKISCNQLLDLL